MSPQLREALGLLRDGTRALLRVRWVRRVAIVVVLALLARAGLEWMLASAINRLAAPRNLVCEWEHLDLSVLNGRGELRFLEVRPRPEPGEAPRTPLLEVEYAVFDLELLPLFVGDLRIRRAEVDGADARIDRDAAGHWNLEQHVLLSEVLGLVEAQEPPPESEPGPLDLRSPVAVEALRIQDARLHLRDTSITPEVTVRLKFDVALSGLDTSEQPARISATVTAPGVLDGAQVAGRLSWTEQGLHIDLEGQLGGLRPAEFAPWLAPLDIRPFAREIGGTLNAELDLEVVGEASDALRVDAALFDLRLEVDGEEALALDRLELEVASLSGESAHIPEVRVTGLRGTASTEASGALRLAGFELDLAAAAESGHAPLDALVSALELWTSESLPRWATLLVRPDAQAYPWTLGKFTIAEGAFSFTDNRVTPPGAFALLIDQVEIGTVAHDPIGDPPAIPIDVRLGAPGLAESIHLYGELDPFAPSRSLDLSLDLSGIGMQAIEGYLSHAGLESSMADGSLHAHLAGAAQTGPTGRTEGWIEFDRLALQEDEDLLQLGSIAAHGVVFDPEAWSMRLGEVDIAGLQLAFGRDPSNRIVALGLRTLGLAPATPPAARAASTSVAGSSTLPPLRLEIGRFAMDDSRVAFTDTLVSPPREVGVEGLSFELHDLTLGGVASASEHEPARFSARARAPGIFDQLTLEGSIRSRPGTIDVVGDLVFRCEGLEGQLMAPYLRAVGIEPMIDDGSLTAKVLAALRLDGGWRASLSLTEVALQDRGGSIASLGELSIEELEIDERITVGSLAVNDAFVALARDPSGNLVVGGVRLVGAPAKEPAHELDATVALSWPALPALLVREASVSNARVGWSDRTFDPALESSVVIQAAASEISTLGAAGAFTAQLEIPETLAELRLEGALELSESGLVLTSSVAASGLSAGPLTRMLPPGVSLAHTEQGAAILEATLGLQAGAAEAGGLRLRIEAGDFALGAAGTEPSIAFDRLIAEAPRIQPAGGVIELGPVSMEGLTLRVERDEAGSLHAANLVLAPTPQGSAPAAQPDAAEPGEAAGNLGLPAALPRIELVGDVSLELERLTLTDAVLGPLARPVEASALFTVRSPAVLIDDSPLDLPPLSWTLGGAVAGLVEHWSVESQVSPFAAEPRIEAEFQAHGLRTAGVVEIAPAWFSAARGVVEDGEASAHLEGNLFVRRARPTHLGISQPFGAELALTEVGFREAPGGRALAGVDRISLEVKRVDIDHGQVHAELLEVTRPHGFASKTGNLVRLLGFEFDLEVLAEAADESAGTEAPPAATIDAEQAAADTLASSPKDSTAELRLDTLLVTDVDLRFTDDTGTPTLELALTELDGEVKQLTTRALVEPRPIQFSALLGSGAEGVFDEIAISGRVAPFPAPEGWASLALSGLELPPFAGVAQGQGLDITDGALDSSVRLRFQGAGGAHVSSSIVFTDLSLEEAEGGPVESMLSLPMALDTALFILRNADGEHRFSVGFDVDADGVSKSQLALAGTQAFAGVLARALAGAPLRLLGGLLPSAEKPDDPGAVFAIEFAAANGELGAVQDALLQAQRTMASDDRWVAVVRHELSAEDLRLAERLANPTASECVELTERLLQRRSELLRRREALSTSARTLFAVGAPQAAEASQELRTLAQEIAKLEDGLDRVLEVLRSDSPRQREKRTRAACREIAQRRLDLVSRTLTAGARIRSSKRIESRSPRYDVVESTTAGAGGRVIIELRKR